MKLAGYKPGSRWLEPHHVELTAVVFFRFRKFVAGWGFCHGGAAAYADGLDKEPAVEMA